MSIIEFRSVDKFFGDFQVLQDIDFTVEEGQVVVVIGPSGSGKSTLLRCINALEEILSPEPSRGVSNRHKLLFGLFSGFFVPGFFDLNGRRAQGSTLALYKAALGGVGLDHNRQL